MRVTLTFDNGPHPVGTPLVLDELGRRGIPAMFFVIGAKAVGAHRALVARAASEGHVIGNHTWSHSGPLGELRPPGAARDEILRAQAAIASFASDPPLFRPVGAAPGGIIDRRLLNDEAAAVLRDGGYTTALWNVLPGDWLNPRGWAAPARDRCRTVDHGVVVLHDSYPDGLAHLPGFLDALIDDGAEFCLELAPECTPMVAGRPGPCFDELVTTVFPQEAADSSHPSTSSVDIPEDRNVMRAMRAPGYRPGDFEEEL
ncbi:polysaccharide deacetylase family protein [Microbacterium insulae]|uniref:Polysaccharide deacetylase family protein n=1 Tax=Microbacterium insulae TaxID=483014 RepID=A0ABW3AHK2_9MICO